MFTAQTGKIIGIPGKQRGLVHEFAVDDEERLKQKGKLIVAASLGGEGVAAAEAGRELLTRIYELYYGREGEILAGLKSAVENTAQETGDAEIGAGVVAGEAIYLAITNGMGIWVCQGANGGWIQKPWGTDGERGVKSFSAWAREGQMIVLGNSFFWENLPEGVLKAAVESGAGDTQAIAETLGAVERGGGKGGEAGAIIRIYNLKSFTDVGEKAGEEMKAQPVEQKRKIIIRGRETAADRIGSWAGRIKQRIIPGSRTIYVGQAEKTSGRKKAAAAGIVFLVLTLILGAAGKWRSEKIEARQSETGQKIEAVITKFNEAKALVGLNDTRSRQILTELKGDLEMLAGKGVKDSRIAAVGEEYSRVLGAASGVIQVNLREVTDLSLLRAEMTGKKIEFSEGKLLILDDKQERLAEINPVSGAGKIVGGSEQLGGGKLLAVYPGRGAVWAQDKGIIECSMISVQCSTKIEKDGEWGEVHDMEMFGGNIYLLAEKDGVNKIWRYPAAGEGYGKKQDWIEEDSLSLSSGLGNMAIDGSIWGIGKGNLAKFTQGAGETVMVTGLEAEWGERAVLETNEETEKLYILDQDNGRIIILKKNGEYEKQLEAEEFRNAIDIALDSEKGKIYVTGGSKIFEISI